MADGTNTLPDAFNSPVAGTKYALKQVYRDPVLRKAYVYFIDANTGTVLNSLNGYTLWEAGLGVGTPTTGDPAKPATPKEEQIDPSNSQIRNDGFDNPQSGFNVNNLYSRKDGLNFSNNNPAQNVRSQDYGNNVGRIIVEGAGPATPGTYNVNTPSQAGRTPSDIVSGTRQTSGVNQGFTVTDVAGKAGFSFGSTPTTVANVSDPSQLQSYMGKNENEVPQDVWAGYIAQEATRRNIDPEVAVAVARHEGLNNLGYNTPNLQATSTLSYGREQSYGSLQIHAKAHAETFYGLTGFKVDDPSIPAAMARIQYGLDMMAEKKHLGDWRNTSIALFGDPKARVGLENAKPVGISVTAEVVNGGLLGNTMTASNTPQARDSIGFGLTQPGSKPAGSGAPNIAQMSQAEALQPEGFMSNVNLNNITMADVGQFSRNDTGVPFDEEGAGYRSGVGFGPYDRPTQQERTFTPTQPSLSGFNDFYNVERGTSRIGNNPATGDEFAVARANEKATQDIFAQGPISERTLSGTPVANQQNATGQPPSGPIDYGKVGSGSVVFEAESLHVDAKSGRITTQGPVSVVISDVLPDNAGFGLRNQNVNFVYDSKTGKGVVIANDKASAHAATIANGLLGAKGKLDVGYAKENGIRVATPSQIAWDMMVNANKYADMVLSQEDTRKAMEEIGPKSYIDQVPQLEESSVEGLRARAAENQKLLAEMNIPNAAVDATTGRVTVSVDAISPVRDPSLNWQGVQTPNQGVLDYEATANYNPAFDKGYGKLASDRAIREATTFDSTIAPPTGGFGTYTGAGKARTEAEKVAAAFAVNNYGIEMDSGMPGGVAMPSYNFAAQGPSLSGISPTVSRSFDPAGVGIGYDNGDYGLGGRSAGFGGPSRSSLSDMAGTSFGRGIDSGRQDTPTGANYDKYDWSGGYTGRGGSAQSTRGMDSPSEGGSRFGGSGLGTPDRGGGSSSGGRADRDQQGFSTGTPDRGGGNSGTASNSGAGAGGRGGSSPSTGSGGTGSQGGPGPAGGTGGFSSGSSGGGRGGGYTGGGPTGGPSSSGGYGQGGVGGGFGDNGGRR